MKITEKELGSLIEGCKSILREAKAGNLTSIWFNHYIRIEVIIRRKEKLKLNMYSRKPKNMNN